MDPAKQSRQRQLGEAMVAFVKKIMQHGGKGGDEVMRRHVTENYRQAVREAEMHGVESSLAWHTLGVWTEEGKERIGCFARALDCLDLEANANPEPNALTRWTSVHSRAECLFEIGRIHAREGDPDVARGFLGQALPLAKEARRLRRAANVTNEDRLDQKIQELLDQLPEGSA